MAKTVLLVVASIGYQPVEYETPKKILQHAGYTVKTVSNTTDPAIANNGTTTHVDMNLEGAIKTPYDAVVLVGGPGALENLDTPTAHQLVHEAYKNHKIVAAICISPRILAAAGILKGKRATGWDDDHKLAAFFEAHDVQYIKKPVVIDGTIITATGPAAAQEFGNALVAALKS